MKHVLTFMLLFAVIGCSKTDPALLLPKVSGYWEIDYVEAPNGEKKQYDLNQNIDFIQITDGKEGVRKKLSPSIDGSFTTSQNSASFVVNITGDSLHLAYDTPYAQWKETVIEATDDHMVIFHQNKNKYHYKRFTKVTLNQ